MFSIIIGSIELLWEVIGTESWHPGTRSHKGTSQDRHLTLMTEVCPSMNGGTRVRTHVRSRVALLLGLRVKKYIIIICG